MAPKCHLEEYGKWRIIDRLEAAQTIMGYFKTDSLNAMEAISELWNLKEEELREGGLTRS